jgi:hypothetical protein
MDIDNLIKASGEEVVYAGANSRKVYDLGVGNEYKTPLNVFGL